MIPTPTWAFHLGMDKYCMHSHVEMVQLLRWWKTHDSEDREEGARAEREKEEEEDASGEEEGLCR
jgi:hypothetical protein